MSSVDGRLVSSVDGRLVTVSAGGSLADGGIGGGPALVSAVRFLPTAGRNALVT